jgi:hypothetical protein
VGAYNDDLKDIYQQERAVLAAQDLEWIPDFYNPINKSYYKSPFVSINAGLTRRNEWKKDSSDPDFVYAVSFRTFETFMNNWVKDDNETKRQQYKALLDQTNFRNYLNGAKKAWHSVTTLQGLTDFYANYPRYDHNNVYENPRNED